MNSKLSQLEKNIKRSLWRHSHEQISKFHDPSFILKAIRISCIAITIFFCIGALVGIASLYGLNTTAKDVNRILICLHICLAWFSFIVVLALIFDFKRYFIKSGWLRIAVNVLVLVCLIAFLIPDSKNHILEYLQSEDFLTFTLISYSIIFLSAKCLELADRKKTNPSLLLASSFLFVILIGSFLFMLPKSTTAPISYTDAFFIATSAVCVTGLSPLDISTMYTPFGWLILSILIQVGGLGLIAFTSVFSIFYSGSASIYNQLLIRDAIYSKSMDAVLPTVLYMLGFTLVIESLGAFAIYMSVPSELFASPHDRLIFSIFHSMSAFCNAGFSTIKDGLSNPALMLGSQSFYLEISFLMFLGSIGFPILINYKDKLVGKIKGTIWKDKRFESKVRVDLNTRLVLISSLVLVALGTIFFFIFEYNGTLKGMDFSTKVIQSLFNAILPRTTGFASVNPAEFAVPTVLMVCLLMWVGGSSQSMAGGVKVNTLAVILLSLKATITGHKEPSAFNRTISASAVNRAYSVAVISTLLVFFFTFVLLFLEPQMSFKDIIFEVMSALFTVGSSMGITAELSSASKYTLCMAMFLGRVGLLSILMGFLGAQKEIDSTYPTENVIIS